MHHYSNSHRSHNITIPKYRHQHDIPASHIHPPSHTTTYTTNTDYELRSSLSFVFNLCSLAPRAFL